MVSREKPKTIRLSQRGSVLRTGSIVERPDDCFVSRVRPRKLSGRDRVWSVRLLAEQAVARRESGRDPRGLARPVAGTPGRGETGIAASARRIRGGRDRGRGAVRLAPRRDPALSSCASGRGPIRSGRRGNSTILGRGHGTDPRDRDARRDGGPEDDPNLRSDVRWGHVRIGRRVARVVHLLPDVHQPVRPLGSLPILLFAAVAAGGMVAALSLFRISNSAVAQGDRLVKQGRYQEALAHYERAIRLVRRPSYAWTSRGVAMRYLGRIDEALRCHENAIRLDSENEVAWCNLGTVYFKKGLLAKALDCYDKAIKIRPKYAIAWNNKGVVFARMNRFEDADKCHAKATKLRPEYVAAWLNRGEVLTRLGARDEAQKCLERARSISRTAAA